MIINNIKCYGIIYNIINKINNKHYVGQTIKPNGFNDRYPHKGNGIERVYKFHKNNKNKGNGYNIHLFRAIEKYGFENFEVNEILDIAFSENELNIKEQCWISIFDSFNNGYNQTLGGQGTKGMKSLSGKECPVSRGVMQLSLTGEFIKEWEYISQVEEELGIDSSKICCVCRGQRKSTQGYIWVYKEDYNESEVYFCDNGRKNRKKDNRGVIQLSINKEFIKEYISINEAKRITGVATGNISACCKNKIKLAGGYIWVYENEYNKK